jgi:guanylate kinase
MKTGKLIVIAAPSGAGKTTVVKHILKHIPQLAFSISAATRAIRPNEVNGQDYYFMPVDDFKNKIAADDFVEWEMVYEGKYYGTLKSELQRIWNSGKHVIFDVDVVGGLNIKQKYPTETLSIFIKPPDLQTLIHRLERRNTESKESLHERISKAEHELSFAEKFDVILINDDLKTTLHQAEDLITNYINQKDL